MRLGRILTMGAVGIGTAFVLSGAKAPTALAQAAPGVWEVTGVPGAKAPIRQCVGDVMSLAQFEHRKEHCSLHVVRDGATDLIIEYNCPGGGFGRSEIGLVTPRSLRIDTQGISDGLPFHYLAQARRVGECPSSQSAARH